MSTEPSRKGSGRGGGFQRWRRGRWQGRGKGSGQKENWKNAGEKLSMLIPQLYSFIYNIHMIAQVRKHDCDEYKNQLTQENNAYH